MTLRSNSRFSTVLIVVFSGLPIVVVGAFIAAKGQPVPFADEWIQPIDNALKTAEGSIRFVDLLRQYNDSRPFFTNLLTVVSTVTTGWNLKVEMFVNLLLALLILVLVTSIYWRHEGSALAVALPFSMLLFSLTQRRSWLWAIQSQYFLLVLFVVLSLWVLDRGAVGWRPILVASVFCLCAMLSYSSGLLIWFVLLPAMWLSGYRSGSHYLFWLLAATGALSLFFTGYDFRIGLENSVRNPLFIAKFAVIYIGNALHAYGPRDMGRCILTGAVGVVGVALLSANAAFLHRVHGGWSKVTPWLAIAVFVLGSGCLAAVGRGDSGGLPGALVGRYVTLSLMFWVALTGLILQVIGTVRSREAKSVAARGLLYVNLVVIVVLLPIFIYSNIRGALEMPWVTPSHRLCLERVPESRDLSCLKGLHPVFDPTHPSYRSRSVALEKIDHLKEHELSVFAGGR